MADISIIVINWNTKDLLSKCLHSVLLYSDGINTETIVVDNGSTDGSQELVARQYNFVRLIQNKENLGFAKANNQAIYSCESPFVLLLNSDAMLTEGALDAFLELASQNSKVGIVGGMLLNPDGSFQASFTSFPNLWREFLILSGLGRLFKGRWYPSNGPEEDKGPQIVDYVEGACLFVRRDAINEVGGLCEDYFMYSEEVDWCLRMKRRGWQVWYQPKAKIIHYGGASSRQRKVAREGDLYYSRILFFQKHKSNLEAVLMKWMLVVFVFLKFIYHGILRFLTRNKYGRQVISPIVLLKKLSRG